VKRSKTQVAAVVAEAAVVALVDDEDGMQWWQWGGIQLEAMQQLAGAQREDETAAG
jgi:hypothetical protein